jgi:S1-C subfamily serine protease
VIVLGGAVVARLLSPAQPSSRNQPAASAPPRPIVQIVRQQPGLPDVADVVDRLCPSVAIILPHGSDPADAAKQVPASAYSADGWLVTSAADLPAMPLDAVFGDGRRVSLTDLRSDPVSGLAIVKADASAAPLSFSDPAFPRVGEFGLVVTTPAGTGCSAEAAMIGSDFVTDGGSGIAYVRLRPAPDDWSAGTPLLGADGRVVGIGTSGEPGALIPAPIASVIVDELIRKSLSASTAFGFRTVDYAAPLSTRLGNARSGAGVALVQKGSAAQKAGLLAGDVVVAVDDRAVSSASELSRLLDAETGKARLTVQRGGEQLQFTLKRKPAS